MSCICLGESVCATFIRIDLDTNPVGRITLVRAEYAFTRLQHWQRWCLHIQPPIEITLLGSPLSHRLYFILERLYDKIWLLLIALSATTRVHFIVSFWISGLFCRRWIRIITSFLLLLLTQSRLLWWIFWAVSVSMNFKAGWAFLNTANMLWTFAILWTFGAQSALS